MWLFDKTSFTSTVAYDPSKDIGKSGHKEIAEASADPKGMWLLVRARVEADLLAVEKALRTVKGDETFSVHVTTEASADYSFRALISREDMKAYLNYVVDDIDYGSHFKEVVKANATEPTTRYSAMMGVWGEMARLQPYTPYGSYLGTPGKGWSNYYEPLTTAVDFTPSVKWVSVDDVKTMLTEAGPDAWANDTIEAMNDDAFMLYLTACKNAALNGGGDTPLTADEVDDLVDSLVDQITSPQSLDK